jgi:hypothetical protein
LLAIVHLGHASNSTASQLGIRVAISPAIYGSLYETTFTTQTRIKIRKRPTDCVAFGFVHQPISSILVFVAARPWINAVFALEVGA